jgi:hypothetical protein|tara:strand:- start:8439 stop:8681 length:243 start_codon:yes stop_codon:yes gene_type:complete
MNNNDKLTETNDESEATPKKAPSFIQVMLSVFAAAFGVQSGKNHERDFSTGNPLAYIVGGVLFTLAFILTIVSIVSMVLP